jgi:uncharacterized protein (DUF849 family)
MSTGCPRAPVEFPACRAPYQVSQAGARTAIAIQTLATILGAHVRVGNEDNLWDMKGRGGNQ